MIYRREQLLQQIKQACGEYLIGFENTYKLTSLWPSWRW